MKFILATALCASIALLGACASGPPPKGDGGELGTPSMAVALYVAQVNHAHSVCNALVNSDKSDRFAKWALRVIPVGYWHTQVPMFGTALEHLATHYNNAWSKMSTEQHNAYCTSYAKDVAWAATKSRMSIMDTTEHFVGYFAPLSARYLEIHRKRGKVAAIVGGATSLALTGLSLNETAHGISQSSRGNFGSASGHFDTANSLSTKSAMFDTATTPSATQAVLPCTSYRPFEEFNLDANSGYMLHYYSIRDCKRVHRPQ